MATFNVGQRVRINFPDEPDMHGREATITAVSSPGEWLDDLDVPHIVPVLYDVLVDGVIAASGWDYAYEPHELIPLTDPKVDEFIETVKRWGPLHEEPKRRLTPEELVNKIMGAA